MRATLRRTFTATVLLACIGLHGAASAALFTSLVTFGDSSTDTGNNAFVFDTVIGPPLPPGTLRTPTPIPASDFVPTFPYQSDRYSNGPVWVEPFAAMLGAHAGLDLSAGAQAALLGGANFAYGGARMGPPGATFPLNVTDQVGLYLTTTGGAASATALYVVQGGGNDARDALLVAAGGGDPTPFISDYVTNTVSVLSQLHAAGAENFLFLTVPNIGLAPAVRAQGAAAIIAGTQVAVAMNAALAGALSGLSPALLDGIHELDLFDLLNDIVSSPPAFGFTDVTSACAAVPACIGDPATTLFWDGIHLTTAGHAAVARAAFVAVVPALVSEPPSLMLVAFGLLAARLARRRWGAALPPRSM